MPRPKPNKKTSLSKSNYQALADDLLGTVQNVSTLCFVRFRHVWDDADYANMRLHTGLYKCSDCNLWTIDKNNSAKTICDGCVTGLGGPK